jgi:hypothetical protein
MEIDEKKNQAISIDIQLSCLLRSQGVRNFIDWQGFKHEVPCRKQVLLYVSPERKPVDGLPLAPHSGTIFWTL